MFRKKTITLKYTPVPRTLEVLAALLIFTLLFVLTSLYKDAPDTLPVNYAFFGSVTAWGSRQAALLHPIFALYLYIVLTGIGVLARRMARRDDPRSALSLALTVLLCLKIVYLVYALVRTYATMRAQDMPFFAGCILPVGIACTLLFGIALDKQRKKQERIPPV